MSRFVVCKSDVGWSVRDNVSGDALQFFDTYNEAKASCDMWNWHPPKWLAQPDPRFRVHEGNNGWWDVWDSHQSLFTESFRTLSQAEEACAVANSSGGQVQLSKPRHVSRHDGIPQKTVPIRLMTDFILDEDE
jgi:hypothetical protein